MYFCTEIGNVHCRKSLVFRSELLGVSDFALSPDQTTLYVLENKKYVLAADGLCALRPGMTVTTGVEAVDEALQQRRAFT